MSLYRLALCTRALSRPTLLKPAAPRLAIRTYASKGKAKGGKSTADLRPGSKFKLQEAADIQEYEKAEKGMQTSVEWYRKECALLEQRATGRVTPNLLSSVKVKISGSDVPLDKVAVIGVREGTTLVVTVMEETNLKAVEQALYDAKLPGIVPQKADARTVKIPIPKPTVEARTALYTGAQKKAEEIRVQVRKQHATSVKKGKYEKFSVELEEFQKLNDRYVAEVDKILTTLKKATGSK